MHRITETYKRITFIFDEADLKGALRETVVANTGEEELRYATAHLEFIGPEGFDAECVGVKLVLEIATP